MTQPRGKKLKKAELRQCDGVRDWSPLESFSFSRCRPTGRGGEGDRGAWGAGGEITIVTASPLD